MKTSSSLLLSYNQSTRSAFVFEGLFGDDEEESNC